MSNEMDYTALSCIPCKHALTDPIQNLNWLARSARIESLRASPQTPQILYGRPQLACKNARGAYAGPARILCRRLQ